LSQRLAELLTNPELGEQREELAFADLAIDRIAQRALAEDSNADERKELLDALETRRRLVDSLHKNSRAVVPE
jgi:hypothetical protein